MNKSLGNGNIQDEMNSYYIKILNILKEMNKCNIEDGELSSRFFKILQKQAFKIYEFIYEKLSKKEGIIRRSILGKRVDYSGRSVIAPEPNMSIHECYVPYMMALELYKLDVANLLIKKNMSWCYDDALDQIDNCIRYNKYDLFDILVEATDGKNIILNRQPTLHRHGIQSFKIHITKDNVLKIHPFICNSYNADFDGDTMAAYRPLSDKCEEECIDKLSFEQNILSPSTGKSTFGVNQDIVLGLYTLTSDPEPKIKIPLQWFGGEILGDEIYTTKNRVTFNKILPEGFTFINVPCTKKVIESVINMICRKYKPYVVIETVEKIKELGLYYTTKNGQTLSLDGMDSKILNERTDEIFESDSELSEKIEQLNNKDFVNLMRKNFAYSNFVDSGARGSWGQVSQIIACKGYVSNSKGQIYPEPISHSLLTGLTKKEFFMSGYGTRKGLLDTALYTGDSGYLQRKLVYSNCNCEIGENDDCHTERTLDINFDELKTVYDIDQEKFINNIEGRTVYVEHINNEKPIYKLVIPHDSSKQLAVDFKGTILHIRSPLFCKDEKICRTCYGETYDILHSPYAGISSACAIGEMSTQMILRTFHFSGAVNSAQKDSDEVDDITSGLSRVKKLFNGGNDMTYVDRLLKLYKVYTEYSDKLLLIHFEITLSQMMRDPITNERWRLTNNPSYKVISITNVPQAESWLLALAFSKPKQYIIDGLIDSEIRDINKNGILEKIISNNEL